jgi:hypothetical protein
LEEKMVYQVGVLFLDAGVLAAGLLSSAAAVALAAQVLATRAKQAQKVKVPVRSRPERGKKKK